MLFQLEYGVREGRRRRKSTSVSLSIRRVCLSYSPLYPIPMEYSPPENQDQDRHLIHILL